VWLTRKLNNKMTLGAGENAVGGAWWLVLEVVLDDATDLSQYDHVPRNFNLDQDTYVSLGLRIPVLCPASPHDTAR